VGTTCTPKHTYLLLCASILAPSDLPAAEEKALRIAQSALVDPECTEMERDAALVLLDALSNRRAITLAEQRGRVIANIEERLGITHRIDWMRRAFEHRIDLANGQFLFANKFQRRFWAAAASNAWLSVSAPTSAGKSFILAQWLTDKLSAGRFHRIVYIAPTRALVQQVERDLRESLAEAEVGGVGVSSIPFRPEAPATEREILVFTQERLHYYLQSFPDTVIDALIVDEAHKLGDSHRGVLLQDVIEQVTAVNRHATVLFTAPLTENPETLLSEAPEEVSRASLQSDDATVSQNLLWLEPVAGETKQWELSLRREGRSSSLGYLTAPKRLSTIKSKLAVLAILTDTDDGGILVYANGAAQAEDFAEEIARRLPDWPRSKPIRALDELCDETIHKEYKLRAVLRKGVAFHYGNMPLLLRTAIEDLFREGHIRYLVCTSTLVEGVNLPCRNIVIRAPKKGKRVDMAPADFWNLAGRAGRWGKEFQGNVICVDTQDKEAWGDTLPSGRGRYRVERTTDRLLKDEKMLLEYITQRAPADRAENNQDLESAISYLTSIRYQYGSLLQAPWHGRLEPAKLERIDGALAAALSEIDIPPEWIRRHAGISPFAMRRMIEGLLGLKVSIDNFLPIDPETPEASKQYARIFEMMSHHMTTAFGQGGRCHALGILTTNWMLGYPIKRLISERIGWNRVASRVVV
jgi:superfamily II DNA/RNA helicase